MTTDFRGKNGIDLDFFSASLEYRTSMKRFFDTELWDKEWFMELSPKMKCLVQFIFAKCDQAGVWSPNWTLASAQIKERVSENDLLPLKEHFEKLPTGKYFVVDFIQFQYGTLTENCMPHRKIILLLKKYGLYERVLKGYQKPTIVRAQEENKEEDKEEEEDNTGGPGETSTDETPKEFILRHSSIVLEELNMHSGLNQQEFSFCMEQWSLRCIEDGWVFTKDPPADLRRLLAGFKKWMNSWVKNNLKDSKNGKNGFSKKGGHDTSKSDAAADAILKQIARDKHRTGTDG